MSGDERKDAFIAEMRTQTALLRQILIALKPASAAAPDNLLSGTHGDPLVRMKDPRDWTGQPMKGRQFSECPPEYLDMLAERFDYFARKNTDELNAVGPDGDEERIAKLEKDIKYGTLDAQRARGWAARLRSGWKPSALPNRVDEAQTEPQW